jgi:hypothetical protein
MVLRRGSNMSEFFIVALGGVKELSRDAIYCSLKGAKRNSKSWADFFRLPWRSQRFVV